MSSRSSRRRARAAAAARAPRSFAAVPVRPRHDGWTPGRQVAFVHALAATACVAEACQAVGMSPRSYYDLRARPDAGSFRQAADAALDVAVQRLEDAALGRALHGEAIPVFYRGEQVGERRRYDNRLAQFLLRARAPERYGRWRDGVQQVRDHPDGAALFLERAVRRLAEDGRADLAGQPRPARAPLRPTLRADAGEPDAPAPPMGERPEAERDACWEEILLRQVGPDGRIRPVSPR